MDGTQFDQLIKQLGTTRLTRLAALRGLVAGALAGATGVGLTREEAGAKKKNRDEKEIRICNCADANPASCKTQKKDKKKAKKTLRRNPCAYRGRCTGVSGCAVTPTTTARPTTTAAPAPPGFDCRVSGCVGANQGLVCDTATGQCVNCVDFTQCPGNRLCLNGRCLADVGCDTDADCANVLGPGIEEMICNESNENPEAPDDVCILDPSFYFGTQCDSNNDCDFLEQFFFPGFPFSCVDFVCVIDCREEGQEDCDEFYGPDPAVCVGGACLQRPS